MLRWAITLICFVLAALSLVFHTAPDSVPDGLWKYFDWGGIGSLLITLGFVLIFRIYEEAREIYKKKYEDNLWRIVILALLLTGLVGIWQTIRAICYYFVLYVKNVSFYYPSDIFGMLAFVLTANVCFTLYRVFDKMARAEKDVELGLDKMEEKVSTSESHKEKDVELGLIGVLLQAIIIGLITLLPRLYDETFLKNLGGPVGYVSVFLVLVFAVVLLIVLRTRVKERTSEHNS